MTSAASICFTNVRAYHTPVRLTVLLLALCGALFLGTGCASRQRQPADIDDDRSIERPAVPMSEETDLVDRIGEVGVVLLVVGVAVGLILIPILLF
jgi:hypothetical protein